MGTYSNTIVTEIVRRGKELTDKPAFIFIGKDFKRKVLTFGEVSDLGSKYAALLRNKGIGAGDVVCNTLPNGAERLVTQIGTLMAGAVDMNGQLCLADGADFINSLTDGQAKAVIYDPQEEKGAFAILKRKINITDCDIGANVVCPDVPSLQLLVPCAISSSKQTVKPFLEELKDTSESLVADSDPSAVAALMCTSGSTGLFKLVAFNGSYPVEWGHHFANVLGVSRDSTYLNDRPLGWLGGYPSVTFSVGCTRVIIDASVSRSENFASFYLEVIHREKCTVAYTVNLLLHNLIEDVTRNPCKEQHLLKSVGVGSGPISKHILKAIGTVSESVATVYASTETAVMATCRLTDTDTEFDDFVTGWPTPETQLKIVDEFMNEIPDRQTGDILVKTSLRCNGYVNNEEANADTFLRDGWVRLGDRGFRNSNGQVSVLGRGKHAIMRGAFVVYPEQLEFRIQQCPGITGVVIVGVPDAGRYEEICALLVRQKSTPDAVTLDEEQVHQFCRDQLFLNTDNVEFNPLPKYYRFVKAFPTLANGKIDRSACKRLASELM